MLGLQVELEINTVVVTRTARWLRKISDKWEWHNVVLVLAIGCSGIGNNQGCLLILVRNQFRQSELTADV